MVAVLYGFRQGLECLAPVAILDFKLQGPEQAGPEFSRQEVFDSAFSFLLCKIDTAHNVLIIGLERGAVAAGRDLQLIQPEKLRKGNFNAFPGIGKFDASIGQDSFSCGY